MRIEDFMGRIWKGIPWILLAIQSGFIVWILGSVAIADEVIFYEPNKVIIWSEVGFNVILVAWGIKKYFGGIINGS